MIKSVSNENKQNNIFCSFPNGQKVKKGYMSYRNHRAEEVDTFTSIKTAAGAAIGAAIPVLSFLKKRDGKLTGVKQFFSLKYGYKEMMAVSLSAIIGGVLFGMAGEKKERRKTKVNEGVFQFMNTAVPTTIVCGFLELCKRNKPLNKTSYKIAGTAAGLVGGMYVGADLSNKINDPHDRVPDRKITMKDAIANIDDAFGALVIAKFKCIEKLHVEKALPVIFAWCGYRAGESN